MFLLLSPIRVMVSYGQSHSILQEAIVEPYLFHDQGASQEVFAKQDCLLKTDLSAKGSCVLYPVEPPSQPARDLLKWRVARARSSICRDRPTPLLTA